MLIYHKFPNRSSAESFASTVNTQTGRAVQVCDTQEESNAIDPFPFELTPPIVLVERTDEPEWKIPAVAKFKGTFAGT